MSKLQAYTVLVICNLFGLLGIIGSTQQYFLAKSSVNWPSVDGEVTSSKVIGSYTDSVKSYYVSRAAIAYAYTLEGREYLGDRRTFRPPERSFEQSTIAAENVVDQYSVGQTVRVYFSPSDPQVSVLEPGASLGMLVPALIGILLMSCTTIFVLFVAGEELLPSSVWLWIRIKRAGQEQIQHSTADEVTSIAWASEIRESILRWEPGVCVILKRNRSNSLSLLFYSTIIGAFLGIVSGIFFTITSLEHGGLASSVPTSATKVFAVTTTLLFVISRLQDQRTAVSIDWFTKKYSIRREFARMRSGPIRDIRQLIVRCCQPRQSVRRFYATVELQLPSENVAIARTDQLRRKPTVAKQHAADLAEPLAVALGIPIVFAGF